MKREKMKGSNDCVVCKENAKKNYPGEGLRQHRKRGIISQTVKGYVTC